MNTRTALLALLAVLVLALAACGGDDEDSGGDKADTQETTAETTEEAPATTEPATTEAAPASRAEEISACLEANGSITDDTDNPNVPESVEAQIGMDGAGAIIYVFADEAAAEADADAIEDLPYNKTSDVKQVADTVVVSMEAENLEKASACISP